VWPRDPGYILSMKDCWAILLFVVDWPVDSVSSHDIPYRWQKHQSVNVLEVYSVAVSGFSHCIDSIELGD
jgi:hypothetical protein